MVIIQILENDDCIDAEDWCRPLVLVTMSGGHSDYYSFESCYSGAPENNVQWVKVREVFGECWYGHPVKEVLKKLSIKYEFARGNIPRSHTMKSKREEESAQAARDSKLDNTVLSFGKHKGKTPNDLLSYDPDYLIWLDHNIPGIVSETIRKKLR